MGKAGYTTLLRICKGIVDTKQDYILYNDIVSIIQKKAGLDRRTIEKYLTFMIKEKFIVRNGSIFSITRKRINDELAENIII